MWNISKFVAPDSEVDFFPGEGAGATNREGGRVLIVLSGVKAGPRWNRMGLFAKVRGGIQSYGRVITAVSPLGTFTYGRRTNLAVDLGGVVEIYPSKRVAIRFDVNDVRIHFNTGFSKVWGNNLQTSTGLVFRFEGLTIQGWLLVLRSAPKPPRTPPLCLRSDCRLSACMVPQTMPVDLRYIPELEPALPELVRLWMKRIGR